MPKDLSYYQALPYKRRVRLEKDERGEEYFVAFIEELDGVMGDGRGPVEAHFHLQQAFVDYVQAMLEWGEPIPEPTGWPESPVTAEAILAARPAVGVKPMGEVVPEMGEVVPENQPLPQPRLVVEPVYEAA